MSKSSVQPIPEGFSTVSQFIMADDVEKIINFCQKAFDAQIVSELRSSDGKIWHAQVKIGESMILFGDTMGMHAGTTSCTYLYVKDANAMYQKAINAGGKSVQEPKDMFYGDHSGGITDPAGNYWFVATHIEDVKQDELERRARKEEEKMKSQPQKKAA